MGNSESDMNLTAGDMSNSGLSLSEIMKYKKMDGCFMLAIRFPDRCRYLDSAQNAHHVHVDSVFTSSTTAGGKLLYKRESYRVA